MLGAIMMIVMIGVLGYVAMGCVAASALGGGVDHLTFSVAVACVVGIIYILYNAQAIVGMKISVIFG